MNRTQLKILLDSYFPVDLNEQKARHRIFSFVEQYSKCFERSLTIGHITASCWLINHDNTKALLTHHKKLNIWVQLGGHCDGDSDVLRVAIKEAQEESGIKNIQAVSPEIFDIDVHLIPENKKEAAHYHYDIRFLLQAIDDEQISISNESHDLLWVDKNVHNLPPCNESVIRMFNKWIAYK